MSFFPLARPEWNQIYGRDRLGGLVSAVLIPLAVVVVALLDGRPERTPAILALGWTLAGILPAAVRGRTNDGGLELRWRAQPFGAADRWAGAMATHVPLAVLWSLLIAAVAWIEQAPAGLRSPTLFLVAALVGAASASWGVAFGALSRRPWHRAGFLGFGLVMSCWAMLPGVSGPATLAVPSGQALAAMAALPNGLMAAFVPLGLIALSGLAAVILGVAAYGRR